MYANIRTMNNIYLEKNKKALKSLHFARYLFKVLQVNTERNLTGVTF